MKYKKTWLSEDSKDIGLDGKPLPKFKTYDNIVELKKELGEHPNEAVIEYRTLTPEDIEELYEVEVKKAQNLVFQMEEVVELIQQYVDEE